MKRVIRFDRGFLAAALGSFALIAFGVIGLATKGINLGVDFQAGINQYVQLVYPAFEVSYSGAGNAGPLGRRDSRGPGLLRGGCREPDPGIRPGHGREPGRPGRGSLVPARHEGLGVPTGRESPP